MAIDGAFYVPKSVLTCNWRQVEKTKLGRLFYISGFLKYIYIQRARAGFVFVGGWYKICLDVVGVMRGVFFVHSFVLSKSDFDITN